jgi:hypothetical protein
MNVMLATSKVVHAGAFVAGRITARCSVISIRKSWIRWHPIGESEVTCKRCLAIMQRKEK